MRSITLHSASILAGTSLTCGALLVAGAVQAPSTPVMQAAARLLSTDRLTISGPITVEGIPTPKQMMRVEQGISYTVPTGKLFVATGIAWKDASAIYSRSVTIKFNNQIVIGAELFSYDLRTGPQSITVIPPGLVAPAGTTIDVLGIPAPGTGGAGSVLLGYLANQ